jgi:hypothetical protein
MATCGSGVTDAAEGDGGVRNGETLIRLQERIRVSRGLPVAGGSQVDESIEIIKLYCQVFFQVVGNRRMLIYLVENKLVTL